MNLHHLKVFYAVARAGSISAGAERLHISQPAVTREIRDLENNLELPLFDRKPRGVTLTEGGQRLLDYAQRIFSLELAAERDLRDFAHLELGELHLGASATLGAYLLPPLITAFRAQHPSILINLEVSNTREVTRQLDEGRIALGFVEGHFQRANYGHRLLARDALLPVVAPHHPLAGSAPLAAGQLQAFPLYLREPGSGTRASVEQVGWWFGAEQAVGEYRTAGQEQQFSHVSLPSLLYRLAIETHIAPQGCPLRAFAGRWCVKMKPGGDAAG